MAATSLTDTHHIPVVFTLHHSQVTDFHVAQSFVHVDQNSVQKGVVVNLLLYRAMVWIFLSETDRSCSGELVQSILIAFLKVTRSQQHASMVVFVLASLLSSC